MVMMIPQGYDKQEYDDLSDLYVQDGYSGSKCMIRISTMLYTRPPNAMHIIQYTFSSLVIRL